MSARTARWLAGSLFVIYALCVVATVSLVAWDDATASQLFVVSAVGYAVTGVLVALREPANTIGWLLLVTAVSLGVQEFGVALIVATEGPGEQLAARIATQDVWLYVSLIALPLVFPTGRLLTPRWRTVLWLGVVGLALDSAGQALQYPSFDLDASEQVSNPIGVPGPLVDATVAVGIALLIASLVLSTFSLAVRLRRAHGRERLQLKLFVYVVTLAATLLALSATTLLAGSSPPQGVDLLGSIGWLSTLALIMLGLPIAIGVAILRHRLYGIDVVIKRTVVYGSLTATLVATYLILVLVLRAALTPVTGESELAVAGSTLAVAALFRPLRSGLQQVVDRRFYRSRYDAGLAVAGFSARLRDELDLESLGGDLRGVVRDTMQPVHVSLWMRSIP